MAKSDNGTQDGTEPVASDNECQAILLSSSFILTHRCRQELSPNGTFRAKFGNTEREVGWWEEVSQKAYLVGLKRPYDLENERLRPVCLDQEEVLADVFNKDEFILGQKANKTYLNGLSDQASIVDLMPALQKWSQPHLECPQAQFCQGELKCSNQEETVQNEEVEQERWVELLKCRSAGLETSLLAFSRCRSTYFSSPFFIFAQIFRH